MDTGLAEQTLGENSESGDIGGKIDGTMQSANGNGGVVQSTNHDAIDPAKFIREPGKRGRHPGNCECDKCASKRSAGLEPDKRSARSDNAKPAPKTNKAVAVNSLGKKLVGVHSMAAILAKNPMLQITDAQGEDLAAALKEVADLHDIKLSPKVVAYANLFAVSAAIYGPKIFMITMAQKANAEKAKQEQALRNAGKVSENTMGVDPNALNGTGKMKFH